MKGHMAKDCRRKPQGESGHAVKSELAFMCQECEPEENQRNEESFWDDFEIGVAHLVHQTCI